jgi:sirohydrochlorin ferrochelatase
MTFAIDTGSAQPTWQAKSAVVDETQNIRFSNWTRADRAKRQVIEEIEGCELAKDVDDYVAAESIMIDALFLFDPIMADEIADAAEAQKAILKSGGVEAATPDPHPAAPGNVLNKTF